jgi:hypothetical protein
MSTRSISAPQSRTPDPNTIGPRSPSPRPELPQSSLLQRKTSKESVIDLAGVGVDLLLLDGMIDNFVKIIITETYIRLSRIGRAFSAGFGNERPNDKGRRRRAHLAGPQSRIDSSSPDLTTPSRHPALRQHVATMRTHASGFLPPDKSPLYWWGFGHRPPKTAASSIGQSQSDIGSNRPRWDSIIRSSCAQRAAYTNIRQSIRRLTATYSASSRSIATRCPSSDPPTYRAPSFALCILPRQTRLGPRTNRPP